MMTATDAITIPVDGETARLYQSATSEQKQKVRLLLNIWLKKTTATISQHKQFLDNLSEKAESRGLTPEILASIL
jgi:hypothetical protein